MIDLHPESVQLARFREGAASTDERATVVRHLLTGCTRCQELIGDWDPVRPGERNGDGEPRPRHDYSGVFNRLEQTFAHRQVELAEERGDAPALRAELAQHPEHRQRMMIRNSRRFHVWSLGQMLCDESERLRPRDPAKAVVRAGLAVEVCDRLDPEQYGSALTRDLRARAWGHLAIAHRAAGAYPEAHEAFETARVHLRVGTGDPVEGAHLLWLEASLHVTERRFDRAFSLLDQVIAVAKRYGEHHLCGKALLSKSYCYTRAGEPEAAIALLDEGSRLIDPALEPRLVVLARHNLIDALIEAERFEEAISHLERTRALHQQLGNRIDQIRFRWVEGRLALGLRRYEAAEALLRRVRGEMLAEGLHFDAGLVCFELAEIYSRQGRTIEMRELAEEMLPIFRAQSFHSEALATLTVFRDALRMEQVTLGLVQELSEYFDRARPEPGLRTRLHPEP
jgi:tetratricopeptide (TPR) repeat protein